MLFRSFIFLIFLCLFIFERKRDRVRAGSARGKGRHRIWSRLQAPSHQPRARRGARTHGPRDRDLSRSRMPNQLSHPGAPVFLIFKNSSFCLLYGLLAFKGALSDISLRIPVKISFQGQNLCFFWSPIRFSS